MPSAKSGKAGSVVAPDAAAEPEEADLADPGEVEQLRAAQVQAKKGKYGSVKAKPYKPPETPEEKKEKKSWIEIALVDADDKPVPGEPYQIEYADASVSVGTLDAKGFARIEGIEPGTCKVSFPKLDGRSWTKA